MKSGTFACMVIFLLFPGCLKVILKANKNNFSLNLNYLRALKLQESFPNLRIIDIDLTLYKEDLTEIRNSLINHINAYLGRFEEVDYEKYEEFFQKYLELKKEKELTEEEIINLFNKYQNKKTI